MEPGTTDLARSVFGDEFAKLVEAIGAVWARGWTPDELVRAAGKLFDPAHSQVMAVGVLEQRRVQPAMATDEWLSRLDRVAAVAVVERPEALVEESKVDQRLLIDAIRHLARWVPVAPRMAFVCDPPGRVVSGVGRRPRAVEQAKLLERVRALLAKAEATQYPHEAEAFTVKAQKMMAENSLELAMLDDPNGEAPAATRIWHDSPYASAKGDLLASIASANGCRTISHGALDASTVFGFRHDLDAVELLYTSLLVQATAEMTTLEAEWQNDRRRIRSFRHSFLIGYAARIGQRLAQVRAAATERVSNSSADVLPVLSGREAEVDKAVADVYPTLRSKRRSSSNSAGYVAGTIAADRANLGSGDRLNRG